MSTESVNQSILATQDCDAELEDTVCRQLGDSGHPGLRGIGVRVDSEYVVLSGTVGSYYLKQVAQETARQACPEHRVFNQLDVPLRSR